MTFEQLFPNTTPETFVKVVLAAIMFAGPAIAWRYGKRQELKAQAQPTQAPPVAPTWQPFVRAFFHLAVASFLGTFSLLMAREGFYLASLLTSGLAWFFAGCFRRAWRIIKP